MVLDINTIIINSFLKQQSFFHQIQKRKVECFYMFIKIQQNALSPKNDTNVNALWTK